MESQRFLFPLFILSVLLGQGFADHPHHFRVRPKKLFVFGDSYVDTGNVHLPTSSGRKIPYGITYPGKPSGRGSDGRILTDYTARYLGLKSPIPYSNLERVGLRRLKLKNNDGVNFAFGGTGVFNTSFPFPNMTTQIDFFQKLILDSELSKTDIYSSVALVSVSGNDYTFYLRTKGSHEGLRPHIMRVVKQIIVNLKCIKSVGVKKILVTGLGPVGCLPLTTASSSFRQCNQTQNLMFNFHNLLLKKAVAKLNTQTKDSPFFILDIYGSFLSIIKNKGYPQGNIKFKTPLKPCCYGVSKEFSCGSVDENGNKKYVLCKDPKSAFYWDEAHPTQEGWMTAFSSLKSSLKSHL